MWPIILGRSVCRRRLSGSLTGARLRCVVAGQPCRLPRSFQRLVREARSRQTHTGRDGLPLRPESGCLRHVDSTNLAEFWYC